MSQELIEKPNGKTQILINRVLLVTLGILLFLLGRYSIPLEDEISIPYKIVDDKNQSEEIKDLISTISKYDEIEIDNDLTRLQDASVSKINDTNQGKYLYVASKKGKKFYEIKSKKAKQLSDKNKIYFQTKEEAVQAGYKE